MPNNTAWTFLRLQMLLMDFKNAESDYAIMNFSLPFGFLVPDVLPLESCHCGDCVCAVRNHYHQLPLTMGSYNRSDMCPSFLASSIKTLST